MGKLKNSKDITWEAALEKCMPIILKLASQFSAAPNSVVDRDDLINCGLMGLMEARQNFASKKQVKFSTFAYFRIRGSMLDEIRRYQPHKRNVMDKHKKIQQAQAKVLNFPDKNAAREAQKKKVSKLCGYSQKEMDEIAQIVSIRRTRTNVEELSRDENNPEQLTQNKQREEGLRNAVSKLNQAEQNVINFRFHRELRLKEIGQKLNLSEARIHQLEKSALRKLKSLAREEGLDSAA